MKFRIYITFDTGDQHLDTDWCDEQTLYRSIHRLRHGPISKMGDLLPAIEKGLKGVEAGECHFIDVHVSTGYAVPPLMRGGSKGE